MKKILFILGLLISANVYAQPKQIYVGGDVLTVSGDTLYKNGVFLAVLGGGGGGTLQSVLDAGDSSNRGFYINGMMLNSGGDNDIKLGKSAGNPNSPNIAIGELSASAGGEDNCIAIGDSAAFTTIAASQFIAIGKSAGINGNGQESIIIGNNAGRNSEGDFNTIIGFVLGENITGSRNTLLGQDGSNDITGDNNFSYSNNSVKGRIVGDNNINFNTEIVNGNNNISFYGDSLSGNDNIGMGSYSLSNSQGDYNVGIGWEAGDSIISDYNVALGYRALSYNNKDGGVGIGIDAGYRNTGENLIAIGNNAGINNTYDNVIALGRFATADSSRQLVLSDNTNSIRFSMANITDNRKYYLPNKTGTFALLDDVTGGGGSNFPTVNDTTTANRSLYLNTYSLLFNHASGNAFTLNNTGLTYDVGGLNAITVNASYNEFKTADDLSTYGLLKTTNSSAQLYALGGGNSSSVTAYPRYIELNGQDSTLMKNIPIDTLTYHLGLKGNKVVKTTNPLPYREYVASLTQSGTDAPVATVLFNNLGDSVVWTYVTEGQYTPLYYNGGAADIDVASDYTSITNSTMVVGGDIRIITVRSGIRSDVYTVSAAGSGRDDVLGANTPVENIITIRVYE